MKIRASDSPEREGPDEEVGLTSLNPIRIGRRAKPAAEPAEGEEGELTWPADEMLEGKGPTWTRRAAPSPEGEHRVVRYLQEYIGGAKADGDEWVRVPVLYLQLAVDALRASRTGDERGSRG